MTGILSDTTSPIQSITTHEMLQYIIESTVYLVSHKTLLGYPEETRIVLYKSVQNSERGPSLFNAVTGVNDPTFILFLNKT